jgi:hypothetical protein
MLMCYDVSRKAKVTHVTDLHFYGRSNLKLVSLVERFITVASRDCRSEMMNATRYVDMGTVSL